MQCIASRHGEPHEYATLVVDSVARLERLIWAVVCEKRSVASIEEMDYGKGHAFALEHWHRVIESLDYIRRDRGMAVYHDAFTGVGLFAGTPTGRGIAEEIAAIACPWAVVDLMSEAHAGKRSPASEADMRRILERVWAEPTAIARSGHRFHA